MRVLACTDLSEPADAAVREAAAMARGPQDALGVLHVLPPRPLIDSLLPGRAADRTQAIETGRGAVRDAIGRAGSPEAEVLVDEGVDYATIVERAETWRADVVVVASHGRSGVSRHLGGVAEAVLRNAHCNVMVVRQSTGRGWVLAATDLSDGSLPAITAAAAEARRRHARVEVVRALGFLEVEATYLLEPPSIAATRSVFDVAEEQLADCVRHLDVEAVCKVLDRHAPAAIVGEAESIGAELVVVGSRGRTGLLRLPLGRVAERVARAAHCSVLVVR